MRVDYTNIPRHIQTCDMNCGSAFEPGASGLPYSCTSICVRSWCNWRASCVDSKPKKKCVRNTIAAKTNENCHNPLLANLKLQLNQIRKSLKQVYRKPNSAHLLAHAHELKVTLFTTTINTAWKLLRDYKSDDSSVSPQVPSQMRTNISADKRMWTEGDIQREPHIGIKAGTNIDITWVTIFKITFSRLGVNLKQIESHSHSTHPTHPTRISQIPNSTKPPPGRKLRKW